MVFSFERLVWLTPQKYTEMATFNFGNVCAAKKFLEVLPEETKTQKKSSKKLKKQKKKINSLLYSLREYEEFMLNILNCFC